MAARRRTLNFKKVLQTLLNDQKPLPEFFSGHLQDLSPQEAARLREVWPQIPLERRRALLEEMERVTDADLRVSFKAVGLLALDDPDAQVRFGGVRVLWVEEDPQLIPRFLALARNDPNISVRANAVGALGSYMYLASLEELPPKLTHQIEEELMALLRNPREPDEVRRQALEVLGYSLNLDMSDWIEQALSGDEDWQASGLFAIARTADTAWADRVVSFLQHQSPAVRAEAARAAGALGLQETVDTLIALLHDPDAQVRMATAWALSEIGGSEKIAEALEEALENATDEEEAALLEEALDNLAFTNDLLEMVMMDLPLDEAGVLSSEEEIEHLLRLFGGEVEDEHEEDNEA